MDNKEERKKTIIKIKKLSCLLIITTVFCVLPAIAKAASLYFYPGTKTVNVGDIVNISVYINSNGTSINNSEATINFPTDNLEVLSVSKSGSIFSLWVEDPSFSNGNGTISFNGGLPTPGYTGNGGKVLSAVFKAKSSGSATLIFSSAAIRANDGLGTNVFGGAGQSQLTLIDKKSATTVKTEKAEEEKPKTAEPAKETPPSISLAKIYSNSHPDQNKWYSNNNVNVAWSLPANTNSVKVLVDKKAQATPSIAYTPAIKDKTITDIEDGVWYLHVQPRVASTWGEVSNFRLQIDTGKPEYFRIKFLEKDDSNKVKNNITFDSRDNLSGIDHYEISVDTSPTVVWQDDGSHTYPLFNLAPGKHTVKAKAVDGAGNYLTDSLDIIIMETAIPTEGLVEENPITNNTPKISNYPKELEAGLPLVVSGQGMPNAEIMIWLQKNNETAQGRTIITDEYGKFKLTLDSKTGLGTYKLWAKDNRQTEQSEKITITVVPEKLINSKNLIFILIIAILLFIIGIFAFKRQSFAKAKRIENKLQKALDFMKQESKNQIYFLKKTEAQRMLTREERETLRKLESDLEETERFIARKK